MKKFLRFSLVALFAVLGMSNAMAQEVTLDFTLETESGSKVSVWGFPASSSNKTVDEQSFTYDGYTVKVAGSTGQGYYWHDKDHYLLFGKQGAYVTLPAFSFDVERIDIEIPGSASGKVTQNIFVGDNAVSTETTGNGTKNFLIASDKQAAGTIYTIKVTNAYNNQIKKILIWKKGTSGDQKLQAGIAWSKATASVTYGNADDTYQYLPTFQNPNNLTGITFSSDNSDAVSISTDGEIEVEGVGEATLTASFAGNDQYEAAEVTCKVTVKEAEPEKTDISNTEETAYTIAKAIELIEDANSDLTKEVYVKGRVSKVDSYNSTYKSITYWISDDGTTTSQQFEIYGGLNIGGADGDGFASKDDIKVGATVVVKGKMKKFKSGENITYEMDKNNVLISYDESTAIDVPETEATIAELYTFTSPTSDIKLTITNGKVVYVNGNSAYVRDGAKAIYFYNTGLSLPLNAEVSGTVNVDLDIYNGLHEVKKNSKTSADNLTITESSEEAVPVEATFDKLASKDYTNDLIIIKNQSVIEDDGKWYIQNGDAKIQLFKKNADYSSYVSDTKKYDIIAIATVYNSNAQLTPISFSETTGIQNLTIDTDVNAPMYNLKGERVDANYRGVVIKGGKKTIQK